MTSGWSSCLNGYVSRLMVSTISLPRITCLFHPATTTCGSSVVTNTGPAIVTLKGGSVLVVY